jgi:hypothetical protein
MKKILITIIFTISILKTASSQVFYTDKTLNLRSGPGINYEIITTLPKESEISILDSNLILKKYKVEEENFDVPEEMLESFLIKFPNAIEDTGTVKKKKLTEKLRKQLEEIANNLYNKGESEQVIQDKVDAFVDLFGEEDGKDMQTNWWHVSWEGYEGYVFAKHIKHYTILKYTRNTNDIIVKKTPNNDWSKKVYKSGQTPECENVDPRYDYKLDNYLKVNVGSHTDVVIKLMKKQYGGDLCIRVVYIRSNETYYLKNIPEGNYYLKIAYGSDWRQKIVDQQCYGKFMKNAQYEIGKERLDYNVIHKNDGYQVPSFELSLDVIVKRGTKPTFNSNDISEAEFNK